MVVNLAEAIATFFVIYGGYMNILFIVTIDYFVVIKWWYKCPTNYVDL